MEHSSIVDPEQARYSRFQAPGFERGRRHSAEGALVEDVGFNPELLIAASVTPFRPDESLDLERLASHIDSMLDAGITGIMAIGGCGEYANLTPKEREKVTRETVRVVDGRVPVIIGALGPSTREALAVGVFAAHAGASTLLVLPPYYVKPSFEGVMQHFKTIAEETGTKVIVYNIPGRTGLDLSLAQLLEIADIPGVVAIKECARDVGAISLKIGGLEGRMAVLSGDDDLGFATLISGASGAIWATPNLAPKLSLDLFTACKRGDTSYALSLHNRLVQIFSAWMLP